MISKTMEKIHDAPKSEISKRFFDIICFTLFGFTCEFSVSSCNNKTLLSNTTSSYNNINRYRLILLYTKFGYYVNRGLKIMISYDRLWQTMKEKGVTQYTLIKKYNISPGQITRLKRNESVSTHTIEVFCRILKCNIEDIMQYIEDEET